jgi:hypothetical protein
VSDDLDVRHVADPGRRRVVLPRHVLRREATVTRAKDFLRESGMSTSDIHPNEEEAVGDWLAFRYSNPHVENWENLTLDYRVHWLREARDFITYFDHFRKVRAAEIERRQGS